VEALIALFALGILAAVLIAPVLAIVALVRVNRLSAEVREMTAALGAAQKLLRARAQATQGTAEEPAPEAGAERVSVRVPPIAPMPARAAAAPPVDVHATLRTRPAPPAPSAGTPHAAAPATVDADATLRVPPPAAAAPAAAPAVPPPRVEAALPPPSRPAPPSVPPPPPPPAPAFDWESLLGLRGAAWAGGIAIAIAGLLFAKLAVERGVFTPALRVALMLASGVGALLGAELSLRRGYATTANAVSGAGIAVLYACFFAAHSLYGLLPMPLTFALMGLVTVVACVLSIRYDALFTALLGLLGGFATPIVLSTGQDRPLGLFSYVLLLDLGLLGLALYKRWASLAVLSLAGTFVIQIGWFGVHMSPAKTLVGLTAFLVFGLLYLFVPARAGGDGRGAFAGTGMVGGLLPFLFALLIAAQPAYSAEWPMLFGFVALLDAALVVVGLRRPAPTLIVGAAAATALTLPLWATQGLAPGTLWGPSLFAIVIAAWLNLPARLAPLAGAPDPDDARRWVYEFAGTLAAAGLGLYTLVLVGRGFGEPPWVFVTLLAALGALALERTRAGRLGGVAVLAPAALALLTQVWFFRSTGGPELLRNLALPLLVALAASLAAGARAARRERDDAAGAEDEAGVLLATGVALAGLFGCLVTSRLGGDPWPLYAALAVAAALVVVSALRRGWTALLPLALLAVAAHTLFWQALYFQPADLALVLPFYAGFVLAFLALPFALPATLAPTFARRATPWVTSALAGPALFVPLYDALTRGLGKGAIGALPLALGALSLVGLRGVVGRFAPRPGWGAAEHGRRLDLLALFAAVALGFVALAIPLQLERQWISVAWALEGAAVWWLLARLPHRGLRFFGALLLAAVGARLLLNWDNVLRYEPRGWPILNWLLYTYGVPALCCLAGAAFLRRADARHPERATPAFFAPAAAFLGLVLIFALINLEIADFYSAGRFVEFDWERRAARDLTLSLAWGLYAIVLLVIGAWRAGRALRLIGLGFLLLTVVKVFLFDLSKLEGVYRILSFLGLGIGLVLVSLLYQRFVVCAGRR
jgi:uncharacterized membrane protein